MSNSLVFLSSNNLPLTTTVIIADSLNKRHTDVLALTHKYEAELKTFGVVPFKTELQTRGNRSNNGSSLFSMYAFCKQYEKYITSELKILYPFFLKYRATLAVPEKKSKKEVPCTPFFTNT